LSAAGLLLSDDLLFASRISGTAERIGVTVHVMRTAEALLKQAAEEPPTCVLIDLHNPGLVIEEVVRQLKSQCTPPRIIAYGSHVDVATLKQAREAGCDRVLPRSQFVEELPRALPTWFSQGEDTP
jgi:CheY-like chemotaxis protein